MKVRLLGCFVGVLVLTQGFTQIPKSPNRVDSLGRKVGEWTILYNEKWKETTNKDSIKYYRKINYVKGKPFGYVKDYFLSGKIQMEGKLKSIDPDVHGDGICIWYYEVGKLSSQGEYKNGKKEGFWKEYNQDGSWWEGNYINGKLEGNWKCWFEDGRLSSQGQFKNDKKEGYWIMMKNTQDSILMKGIYKGGKPIGYWSCYKNGWKYGESKDGENWSLYHKDGSLFGRGKIINDNKEGTWVFYYMSGKKLEEGKYFNGLLEGHWIFYYEENGNKDQEGNFIHGKREGIWNYTE